LKSLNLSQSPQINTIKQLSLDPKVKTMRNNIVHAYGICCIDAGSSVGTTDIVAMEFILLKRKTILKR